MNNEIQDMLKRFGVEDCRQGSRSVGHGGVDTGDWEDYIEVPVHTLEKMRTALGVITDQPVAAVTNDIREAFQEWFAREWDSYRANDGIAKSKFESMVWALKGYKAALAQRAGTGGDAIRQLLKRHADELAQNEYAYFELAYIRRTGWMAWICSNSRDDDPTRKVIARGQGETPDEACRAAMGGETS